MIKVTGEVVYARRVPDSNRNEQREYFRLCASQLLDFGIRTDFLVTLNVNP